MSQIALFADGVLTITTADQNTTITAREIERVWDNLSHTPDRRAAWELAALAERLNAFADHVDALASAELAGSSTFDPASEISSFASRQISLTRRAWAMESRCASSFIVGPSNFPVETNRKRLNSADRAYALAREHVANAKRAVERRKYPYGMPGGAIRANNPDAPELIREKLAKCRARQEHMKAVNAAIRHAAKNGEAAMVQAVIDATGWPDDAARAVVCRPANLAYLGPGFASFQLSNNLAEIKRLEARLASVERNRARGTRIRAVETTAGPVQVIENGGAARIQLVFDGKPASEVRDALKHNGFRWSPSEGAWQRHLNEAGRWAVERVLKSLAVTAA